MTNIHIFVLLQQEFKAEIRQKVFVILRWIVAILPKVYTYVVKLSKVAILQEKSLIFITKMCDSIKVVKKLWFLWNKVVIFCKKKEKKSLKFVIL